MSNSPAVDALFYTIMSKTHPYSQTTACAVAAVLIFSGLPADAGHEIGTAPGKDKMMAPVADPLPAGMITFGGKSSSQLQSGYVDSLLPFWAPGDFTVFLNSRATLDDSSQFLSSTGLGARYLVPGHDVILGANAYYDSIDSQYGNHFDQLGLGAEVLTRWVDARFNYYLPDNSQPEIDRTTHESVTRRSGAVFGNQVGPRRILVQQQQFKTVKKTTDIRSEAALEGFNAEIGFLVPGLDQYMELRLFAGAYHYDNPLGEDYSGFKARAEARLLPGVIANVEYWDDTYMTGGHWVGELRVTMPFSFYNLASGRNPFEGAAEMFTPRARDFRERLSDMVLRSHRVLTTTGSSSNSSQSTSVKTDTVNVINLRPPVTASPGVVAPPQVGAGEGGEGGDQ